MSAVVLLGGGGHCRSVIDVIEQTGLYSILGVLEKEGFSCSNLMGYPLLGSDHDLPAFIEQNCAVVIPTSSELVVIAILRGVLI